MLALVTICYNFAYSQVINVYVQEWRVVANVVAPDFAQIQTAYANFYTTVNVTVAPLPTTLGSLDAFDVVWIGDLDANGVNTQVNAAQQQVVEAYIRQGGHVVWLSERLCCGQSVPDHALQTVQGLYGLTLNRNFSSSPTFTPFHGTSGLLGLATGVPTIYTSNSYDYFRGPTSLTDYVIWSKQSGTCLQDSVEAVELFFPGPYLCSVDTGTLLLTGNGVSFNGFITGVDLIRQTQYMRNIASLHQILVDRDSLALQARQSNWAANTQCPLSQGGCSIILPIHLTHFDLQAAKQLGTIEVQWMAEENSQTQGYTIEYWNAIQQQFEPHSYQPAKALLGQASYQLELAGFKPGTHYIRLRLEQVDQSWVYSEIKALTLSHPTATSWQVYPTQITQGSLYIRGPITSQQVKITVYNQHGQIQQLLYQGDWQAGEIRAINLREQSWSAGWYYVQIHWDGGQQLLPIWVS